MWSMETRISRQSGCSSLKAFNPFLWRVFNSALDLILCVSDNGVDCLVIVCVPIGDFLTATVIKLADYASYLTESKAADSASVSEGLGA